MQCEAVKPYKTCSVESCEEFGRLLRGFCNAHYKRFMKGKPLNEPVLPNRKRSCSIEGCNNRHLSKGFCHTHYTKRMHAQTGRLCSVPGCGRGGRIRKNMCDIHYCRVSSGANFTGPVRQLSPAGQARYVDTSGYVIIGVPEGTPGAKRRGRSLPKMQEHRYVMQKHLGRSLSPSEQIHHKDGNKANNEIGNLELKAGAHGTGIRAEDGAVRCIDYLEHYIGLELHQRAVLGEIRKMAEDGKLGPFVDPERQKQRKSR